MRDQLLSAAGALARLVLVVVAFGLAVGSIGLSATRGFCPEVDAQSVAMPALATIVEEPDEPVDTGDAAPDATPTEAPPGDAPAGEAPPGDAPAGEAPAGEAPAGEEPTGEAPEDAADCPGGSQRCLPPLWSSVLLLQEPACHDQAGARLRGTLVPAFVGSTVLLAAAWWLRPTRTDAGRRSAAHEPTDG